MNLTVVSPEEAIKPVQTCDFPVKEEVLDQMWAIVDKHGALGLAANQVGYYQAFFLVNYGKVRNVYCNPHLVTSTHLKRNRIVSSKEGCLSLPNYEFKIARWNFVELQYQDVEGNFKKEFFQGQLALIIQHEYDHLKGRLINGMTYEKVS